MTADPSPRSSLLIDSTLIQPPARRLCAPQGRTDGAHHHHVVRTRALGQLDRATLPMLTEELVRAGRRGFAVSPCVALPAVELDLSGLTFMCTCGLAALNESWQQLADMGGRLCVTGPRPEVLYVLDVAVFSGWLPADLECDQDHPWPVGDTRIGAVVGNHRVHLSPARTRHAAGQAPPPRGLRVASNPLPPLHPGSAV